MKFILIFTILIITNGARLRQTPEEPNRMPTLNIHIEDHDRDPINFRRFDGERVDYQNRIDDLFIHYESQKKTLQSIMEIEIDKIVKLTTDATATYTTAKSIFYP
jgi:hypothetical protein